MNTTIIMMVVIFSILVRDGDDGDRDDEGSCGDDGYGDVEVDDSDDDGEKDDHLRVFLSRMMT